VKLLGGLSASTGLYVNSSPLPISAVRSSSSLLSDIGGISLKLKLLSVGDVIVVEIVDVEK
jgi:hypothetical protein